MQFLNNKYTNWYFNIIYRAQDVKIVNETEHHHVLPRALFPEFNALGKHKWNGVHLTHQEHFICHWLLTKMVTGVWKEKMLYALSMMQMNPIDYRYRSKITARVFAQNKKELSIVKSMRLKVQWANKTQEEKDIIFSKTAEKNKLNWINCSQEEKDAHAHRSVCQWENKSQEEKEAFSLKISNTTTANWKNKSQEEKDAHAKKNKDIWESKSLAQKEAHAQRSRDQYKNRSQTKQELINEKNSKSVSRLRWFNNNTINKRCVPGHEPIGFTLGRLRNKNL